MTTGQLLCLMVLFDLLSFGAIYGLAAWVCVRRGDARDRKREQRQHEALMRRLSAPRYPRDDEQ